MAKYLIFGSGFVVGPAVEYLTKSNDGEVTVATNQLAEAEVLKQSCPNIQIVSVDVTDQQQVAALVQANDVVISLVPYQFHLLIAEQCIVYRRHLVTASYTSEEMHQLNQRAVDAGIILLNEMGLDPGIDHMSAMKIIDQAHRDGWQITQFASWCGGLPSPASNNNPFGYKFSWSPRAVLSATLNEATFLKHGEQRNIPGEQLMLAARDIDFGNGMSLEGYPNRDSLSYIDIYGINQATDVIRGTLRYRGFAELMSAAMQFDLFNDQASTDARTWQEYMQPFEQQWTALSDEQRRAYEWLGLKSDALIEPSSTIIDAFCSLLVERLSYQPGETDTIVLQHKFKLVKGEESKVVRSTLQVEGDSSGSSAMAKTVGLPVAIAARLIANAQIQDSGVCLPVSSDIYQPVLKELARVGLDCMEDELADFDDPFLGA